MSRFCDDVTIKEFEQLRTNWDGYGARPVSEEALNVMRSTGCCPLVDGGVQFEWHVNGWTTEIEFGSDGKPRSLFSVQAVVDQTP